MDSGPKTRPLARRVAGQLSKLGVGGLVGFGMLSWVVDRTAPRTGVVVVHVLEADVTVDLDGERREVHSPYRAVSFEVGAGRHELRLLREERPIDDQEFEVVGGESLVLSAWDRERPEMKAPRQGGGLREFRTRFRRQRQINESPGRAD